MTRPVRCAATRSSSPGRGTCSTRCTTSSPARPATWPPGRPRRPGPRSPGGVHASGTDSFTVRKLFSPMALADEEQRAHLRRLDAGAQVRISSAPLPHETIILDRRVAILAGQPSPLGREYTVTTSPALIGGVYSLFTAAWEAAVGLRAYLRAEVRELS